MPALKDSRVLHVTYGVKPHLTGKAFVLITPKIDVHRSSVGCGFERIDFKLPERLARYATKEFALAGCRLAIMRAILSHAEHNVCEVPSTITFREVLHRKAAKTRPV